MRNHLHPLIKQRTSWNNVKTLTGRYGWVADLVPWSVSSSRDSRGLKPWAGVGGVGSAQILPAMIRSHVSQHSRR